MTFGETIREQRKQEAQREFENLLGERLASAWSAIVDRRYSAVVGSALRAFFRLEPPNYSAHQFLESVECSSDEFAALSDLVKCFEEAVENRCRGTVDTVHEPLRVIGEAPDVIGETWRLYRECSIHAPADRLQLALGVIEAEAVRRDLVADPGEQTHTIGENFEESPLWELWQKRRKQGRILTALIVARDGDTGVGKSTLAVALAKKFDTEWSADRATNRSWEYRNVIQSEPKGSVVVADEFAQMFDARRSMSQENVTSSQDWMMMRRLQISTIGTCPSMAAVDTRFLKLMDIQILVTRRGHARAYRLKIGDDDGSLYREHLCNIEWPDLSDDPDYQAVEEMKEERLQERLEGEDDKADQEGEQIDPDEIERQKRNEVIEQLASSDEFTQRQIAEALNLSPSTVSKILSD